MFERNPEIDDKVNILFTHFADHERGDLVRWEIIESLTGLERYRGIWNSVMTRLKRKVERERGITLWADHSKGYRLLTVEEQLREAPRKRLARAGKQIKRGMDHLDALPVEEMTFEQMRVSSARRESMRVSRNKVLRDKKEVTRQAKPKESLPRIAWTP